MHCSVKHAFQKSSLTLKDEDRPSDNDQQPPSRQRGDGDGLAIDTAVADRDTALTVLPVLSPTSLSINTAGLPLAIFTKVNSPLPPLSLPLSLPSLSTQLYHYSPVDRKFCGVKGDNCVWELTEIDRTYNKLSIINGPISTTIFIVSTDTAV